MPSYVALSKTTHRHAGLRPAGYAHALSQTVVPLTAEELPHVLSTMVTGFILPPEGGGYQLVALQSLHAGVNLYVHTNGRWIAGYQPAWYRAHPFRLLPDSQTGKLVLCVDESAETFTSHAAEDAVRLFDDDGEPADITRKTMGFLENLHRGTETTRAAVTQLADAGLITPWTLKVATTTAVAPQPVQGLYHIDEAALQALPGDTLAELATSGALMIAYAQLMSEHRLKMLTKLYELREEADKQAGAARDVDLEDLFGDDDDDLSFNF